MNILLFCPLFFIKKIRTIASKSYASMVHTSPQSQRVFDEIREIFFFFSFHHEKQDETMRVEKTIFFQKHQNISWLEKKGYARVSHFCQCCLPLP